MQTNSPLSMSDTFLALALEPRIMFDAAATATAEVVVEATESTPGVTAKGAEATIGVDDDTTSETVDLFSDVTVSTDTGDEGLSTLVITVDSSGSDQALIIDGSTIALTVETNSETSTNGYQYSVSVDDGVTTITISIASSSSGYTADSVSTLIDGIKYSVLDNTVDSGTVTVTLSTLSDEGDDTATLNISSTIEVTNDSNVTPVISDTGTLSETISLTDSDLGEVTEILVSSDGDYVYAANEDGDLAVYEITDDGLTRIQFLEEVADGKSILDMVATDTTLYLTTGTESTYGYDNPGSIVVLSIADDGALTVSQTLDVSGSVYYSSFGRSLNGSDTGVNISVSGDGALLVVGTDSDKLFIYSIDSDSGTLTLLNAYGSVDYVDNGSATMSGSYYISVTSGRSYQTVTIYSVSSSDGEATYTLVTSLIISGSNSYNETYADIVISEDGSTIYFANTSTGTIYAVSLDETSGSTVLTEIDSESLSNVTSIALSDDGTKLYATTSDDTLVVYIIDDTGALTESATVDGAGGASVVVTGSLVLTGSSKSITGYAEEITYTLNGSAVTVGSSFSLSDGNLDALSDGEGNYNGASISIAQSVDGTAISSGSFSFEDGNDLTLVDGVIYLNSEAIATFTTSSDGRLTVTFTADTTTEVANQVLSQITYANDDVLSDDTVTLTFTASDGELTSEAQTLTVSISEKPIVNKDVASSYTLDTATTETSYSFTLEKTLFSNADDSTIVWSVDGLPDGLSFDADTLTISGTTTKTGSYTITVTVTNSSGETASLDLTLTVEQIANRAPTASDDAVTELESAVVGTSYSVVLDSDMFSDEDSIYDDTLTWSVTNLPDGLSFDADTLTISGTATTTEDYTITVTVTDASGETASSTMTLRVITEGEANNSSPSVGSSDRSSIYYTSDDGLTGYDYYVDDLTLSDDGSILVIAGSSDRNGNGTSYISIYSRNTETGELTLLQTFTEGETDDSDDSNGIEIDGLLTVTSVTFSDDGKYVYVVGYEETDEVTTSTITIFSVGSDGTLTYVNQLTGISGEVVEIVVSEESSTLYALTESSLYAYTVGSDDGALTLLDTESDDKFSSAVALEVGSDGTVYVLSSSVITIYSAGEDGSLSYAGQLTRNGATLTYTDANGSETEGGTLSNKNGLSGSKDFVVSDDGYIYVVTSNGYLTTLQYDSTSNTLTLVDSTSVYSAVSYPYGITISEDGTTLYLVSPRTNSIGIYSIDEDGIPTLSSTVDSGGRGVSIVVSSDGTSIYTGQNVYSNRTGVNQVSASGLIVSSIEGDAVQIAESLTLSDADYDALADGEGNYNGATITIERSSGADAEDTFSFADGDGLTLTDGVIYLNGSANATLTSIDGTLTVTFTADVTTAVANQVLQKITYTNTSDTPDSSVTLTLTVQDEYVTGTTSLSIRVNITSNNDAPTVSATGATAVSYTEGDTDGVSLFSDTSISTVEDGQTIQSFTLTVSGAEDGDSEVLTIDGTKVSLSAGTGETTNGYNYTVTVAEDGTVTVVISSSDGMSTDTAASLIDSVTYQNSNDAMTTGSRTVTLTAVQDDGGTDDDGADTAELSIVATISLTAVNDAPTVTATGATTTYTEGGMAVSLFSGVSVSTIEDGQTITSLTFTVSGVEDGDSEVLTIDGTEVALTAGSGTTTNGYSYSVSVADDGAVTVVVSSSDGMSTDTAQSLVEGITYADISNDATLGERTVTLTVVQDDGGTENDGDDTADLSIAAIVTVAEVNDAPTLTATGAEVGFSENGSAVSLFSDTSISTVENDQSIRSFELTVSGVEDGANEVLTIDGTSILLETGSGTTTNNYSYSVTVDEDGTVTVVVSSSDGISADTVAEIIDAITFGVTGDDVTSGSRTVTLTAIQDDGGTDNDGVDTTDLSIASTVTITGVNDAPTLTATNNSVTYTEGADGVSLFSDSSVSTIEEGQTISSFTLTISGVEDGESETLTVDGTAISLIVGTGTTTSGYDYAVSVADDGTVTVTFSSSTGIAADAVTLMVDGMTYVNTSSDLTIGDRTVTLTALTDDGGTDNAGEDTTSLAIATTISVTNVNNAPTVSATAATTSYVEGGTPASLFSDTVISTIEDGQDISSFTLTISGAVDGASEALTVDGTTISLVAGLGTTSSGYRYEVSVADDGTVTVVFSSSEGISIDVTASIIDAITYENSDDNTTEGDRTVSLTSLQDNGGSENDGSDTVELAITATVIVSAYNDAPTLTATATGGTYSADGDAVTLFSDAALSTIENDQSISSLTLTFAGVVDSNEVLTIDGTEVTLSDEMEVTTTNGLVVSISVVDGTITITSADGLSSDDAQILINEITYSNASDTVSLGERSFTLTAVQDSGGSDNDATDVTSVTITTTIEVVNSTPIATTSSLSLPSVVASASYSASLSALFNDADGESLTWTLEGLPSGLSFNEETLSLNGSVITAGTYVIVATVTDGSGATATATLSLDVEADVTNVLITQEDVTETSSVDTDTTSDTSTSSEVTVIDALSTLSNASDPSQTAALSLTGDALSFLSTVSEQITGTTDTSDVDLLMEEFGDFDLNGSKWTVTVSAKEGQAFIPLQLPEVAKGNGVRLSLENGMPLPNWVRFDPATGRLNIDSKHMNDVPQLNIRIQSRAQDGTMQETLLEIETQSNGTIIGTGQVETGTAEVGTLEPESEQSDSQADHALMEQEPITLAGGFAPNGLLDEVQELLVNLAGLNPARSIP